LGSSGVRGVYVWDWSLLVTLACLAWRMQARGERDAGEGAKPSRLAVLEAGGPPHASTPRFDVSITAGMETVRIPAAQPLDEVIAAVQRARPTHLRDLELEAEVCTAWAKRSAARSTRPGCRPGY
jgi:phenylacetate-CoA ligase